MASVHYYKVQCREVCRNQKVNDEGAWANQAEEGDQHVGAGLGGAEVGGDK
jgi:hypothetical protein